MLTLLDTTDATASPTDAPLDPVASDTNRPLYNGLEEYDGASDATDATFGLSSEWHRIDVGAPADGPLPEYITTRAQLDTVLPALCAAPLLAVDTETTGLDPLKDHVRLIQFALPDRVIVVDAGTCPVQQLAPVFAAPHLLAFHNAKFDLKFLRAAGLALARGSRVRYDAGGATARCWRGRGYAEGVRLSRRGAALSAH